MIKRHHNRPAAAGRNSDLPAAAATRLRELLRRWLARDGIVLAIFFALTLALTAFPKPASIDDLRQIGLRYLQMTTASSTGSARHCGARFSTRSARRQGSEFLSNTALRGRRANLISVNYDD